MSNFFIENGQLKSDIYTITQIHSPNFNTRPSINDKPIIDTIVIHNISLPPNQFGQKDKDGNHYVTALFTNSLNPDDDPYFEQIKGLEVSAHLFIERNGNIIQFVNFNDRAWHAGQSYYLGKDKVNDFSIGIELEGTDDSEFEAIQYEVLSQIIVAIYHAYPKTHRHLTGHSDIAPKRKTDPGTFFDWQHLRKSIQEQLDKNTLKSILPEIF